MPNIMVTVVPSEYNAFNDVCNKIKDPTTRSMIVEIVEGFSMSELAEKYGVSKTTVYNRIDSLRPMIGKYLEE